MPVKYHIDPVRRIVITMGSGAPTVEELARYQKDLRADPGMDPDFDQFVDFRAITLRDLTRDDLQSLVRNSPFNASSRRAIVVTAELEFGLLRMGEMIAHGSVGTIRIFRDYNEACLWLGIEAVTAAELNV